MKNYLASHPLTCDNCKLLNAAEKKPEIPNAMIQVDLMGPFTSYGDKKFALILTDVATKVTVFKPLKDKSISAIAFAIFSQWICKMAAPQVIDTNLTDEQADALKDEWDDLMLMDIPHIRSSASTGGPATTKWPPTSSQKWSPRQTSDGMISCLLYNSSTTHLNNHLWPLHHLNFYMATNWPCLSHPMKPIRCQ